ncbi:hypothetical protein NDU88_007500 [Pleurodeles waltl]|uniref:Uncharacterized protein n=1 Tax=Pleurodeles waltl TaxID=8319 RepID=A0AAV7RT80_PLEWA|nr:hypothetical protein NDU88_007500 [Pleurodeles waltl]
MDVMLIEHVKITHGSEEKVYKVDIQHRECRGEVGVVNGSLELTDAIENGVLQAAARNSHCLRCASVRWFSRRERAM